MKYAVRRDKSNYVDVNNYFNFLRQNSTYSGTGTYFNTNTGERQEYDFLLYPKKGTKGQTRVVPAGYQLVTVSQLKRILMTKKYTFEQIKKEEIVVFCNLEEANRLSVAGGGSGRHDNPKLTNVRFQNGRMGWMGDDGTYYRNRGCQVFINFDEVDFGEETPTKEIIGYKSPTSFYNGNVPAGTLFVKGNKGAAHWYCPESESEKSSPDWDLPVEIVESWEPVYEAQFKVGDWVYALKGKDFDDYRESQDIPVFQVGEVSIQAKEQWLRATRGVQKGVRGTMCRYATQTEIANANTVTIGGYKAEKEGDKIAFGCNKFTVDQLKAYQHFLTVNNANTMTTQGGEKITLPILNKLIKLYGNI